MTLKALLSSVKTFLQDDPMTYAASIAFYTLISLPGIILIAMNVLNTAYNEAKVKEDLLMRLTTYLGPDTTEQAETILESVDVTDSSILPQIIGAIALIFSATTVFISLQDAINKIWSVKTDEKSGFLHVILSRLLSLAMIVSLGFILLVSLVTDSALAILSRWIESNFGLGSVIVGSVISLLISLLVNTGIFTLIFKILPDVQTRWRYVWRGGLLTAILFMIGKVLIGFYIGYSDVGSSFGASGSLIVFLSWAYYSSILVLFGAKFTYEYTRCNVDSIKSVKSAVFVKEHVVSDSSLET